MTAPDDPAYRWEFRAEDFVYARLGEQQIAATALPPGPEREQALNQVDCLYLIAAEHNIWIDNRGQSAGRCILCTPSEGGVPCTTMRRLARIWRTHLDYVPEWNESYDDPRYRIPSTMNDRLAARRTIWQEREAELNAFYSRFDLVDGRDGEYWKCRTCSAEGEHVNDRLSRQICTSIGAAAPQHPQCPPDPNGPQAWTIRTPIATKEA